MPAQLVWMIGGSLVFWGRNVSSSAVIPFPPASILPGSPPAPCPELLTQEEAIRYLRLDGDRNANRTLKYYREKGLLRGTTVGRHLRYRRIELDRFLELQTTGNTASKR